MSVKFQCDRCQRLFESVEDVTAVEVNGASYDLCEQDMRDLTYFVKQRVSRDRHGNENVVEAR